jgi:hypothetical protein
MTSGGTTLPRVPPPVDQQMESNDLRHKLVNAVTCSNWLLSMSLVMVTAETFQRETENTLRRSFDSTWARQ